MTNEQFWHYTFIFCSIGYTSCIIGTICGNILNEFIKHKLKIKDTK